MNEALDRLESLFAAAMQKPAVERAAYVEQACADDPALRQRVYDLLRAQEGAGSFLESRGPPSPLAAKAEAVSGLATTDDPISERPGTVIGPYKLMEQIGEGGMGLVFVAEQQQPLRRRVALKVIKPGMDTRQVVARFEAERQALALMDHPNIARVLDGGETEGGRPYFVMDLVKGEPITEYCDQNQVPVRGRLALFLDVSQAVQHAHQKGIIHRDVKPSNVLVMSRDGTPVVKVIDFGVAKAVGQQLTDKTIYTEFTQLVGTPLYMSPEQAGRSGIDVDTRTDIYALGVLLYELLTGTTPFVRERLKGVDYDEIRRIIREEEPPRPSTRLSTLGQAATTVSTRRKSDPRRLTQMVRGELDWIVMKALEKDRSRRYETASALAADVQRYLADEPVEARPPSAGYRLGKLLRRHKGPVLAASLLLLALLAGIAGTTYGMLRAEERRAQAEAARERTWQALDAMTSTVTGDSLSTQKAISAEQKKFLAEVLTYYREFAGERADNEQARERTAAAALRVGLIECRLGHYEEGIPAFRQAQGDFAGLVADFPAVPKYRYGLAISHNNLGSLLAVLGQQREAEDHYRQAVTVYEKLAADAPAVPMYRQGLATSHDGLGSLLGDLGQSREAEQQYRQALALLERLAADSPAVPEYRRELARSHNNLGRLLGQLGQEREAEQQYRQALTRLKRLAPDSQAAPEHRMELARSHYGLGSRLANLGQWGEAERQCRQAVIVSEKLAADFPAVPEYRKELACSHSSLGQLLGILGQGAEAEQHYRQYLALAKRLAADFPTVPEYRRGLASSHNNLGNRLFGLGKLAEAEVQDRRALTLCEKLAADSPAMSQYRQQLAISHNNLGLVLQDLGKQAEAGQHYWRALALLEKLAADSPNVPAYHLNLARSHKKLASLLGDQGKRADAEQQYRRALTLCEKLAADSPAVPEYCQELAISHNRLGVVLADLGKLSEAEQQYRPALAVLEKLAADSPAVPEHRQKLAASHHDLGTLLVRLGKLAEAEVQYRRALTLCEKLAADSPDVPQYRRHLAGSHGALGNLLRDQGKYREAEAANRAAMALLETLAADSPAVPEYRHGLAINHNNLGILLHRLGKRADAEQEYRRALALLEKLAADSPAVPAYQISLGLTCCNLGSVLSASGRPDKGVAWFEKATRILTAVYERDRQLVLAKRYLSMSHANRARAYVHLRKFAEAVNDWNTAIELSPPHEQPEYRAFRATARANAGQVAEAVAEVAALPKSSHWNPAQWYNFACVYAVASPKSADKKQEYADRAMQLLHRALKAGFQDAALMAKDTDLDPLRGRDDFKKLLAELTKRAAATPGNQRINHERTPAAPAAASTNGRDRRLPRPSCAAGRGRPSMTDNGLRRRGKQSGGR
jgi:serine/threonine protein kinase/tetratricopeptide (TPR) repeat protein